MFVVRTSLAARWAAIPGGILTARASHNDQAPRMPPDLVS